jgi:hypothetical protein
MAENEEEQMLTVTVTFYPREQTHTGPRSPPVAISCQSPAPTLIKQGEPLLNTDFVETKQNPKHPLLIKLSIYSVCAISFILVSCVWYLLNAKKQAKKSETKVMPSHGWK